MKLALLFPLSNSWFQSLNFNHSLNSSFYFRIVYDRETGKPKGYGFCEYRDQETALCAMRNLNGFEIAGRTLRVDNACTEKSRLEMQSLMQVSQQVLERTN